MKIKPGFALIGAKECKVFFSEYEGFANLKTKEKISVPIIADEIILKDGQAMKELAWDMAKGGVHGGCTVAAGMSYAALINRLQEENGK